MTPTHNETEKITIVTHNGNFHADDIFAVATILLVSGEGANVEVIRTRDEEVINKADFVVDVGRVYDESANRFDHHQLGGAGVRTNSIPYASFGLVWKKYGEHLCGNKEVADEIDRVVVQPNDAVDGGVEIIQPVFKGVYPYNIYDFFESLLPSWKEEEKNADEIFLIAVSYAKIILEREIKRKNDKKEAEKIVVEVYKNSKDKRLIVLDKYYPSSEILMDFAEPLFKIYPRKEGTWAIEGVKTEQNSFNRRKFLPESWAGKENEELEKITGVNGALFCHAGRFIAVADTKEAILQLAKLALDS